VTTTIRFRNRRATLAKWAQLNPVLGDGELGYETDTRRLKFGDGETAWVDLPYGVEQSDLVVSVLDYAAVGDGVALDTDAIQAAIDDAAGRTVFLPARTYLIDATVGIKLNQPGTRLLLDQGTKIKVQANSADAYTAIEVTAPDCVIEGGTIEGDVGTHTGTTGEWGHLIVANGGSDRLRVRGVTVTKAWGDGIAVQGNPSDVSVIDVIADDNRRQGMSIISATRPRVLGGVYKNTGLTASTAPSAGIDVEPNAGGAVVDCLISGVMFSGNKGPNVQVATASTSSVSVSIVGCRAVGSTTSSGVYVVGPTGTIKAKISDVLASANALHGFMINTTGVQLDSVTARANVWYGFQINASDCTLTNPTSKENGRVGFQVNIADNTTVIGGLMQANSQTTSGAYVNFDNWGTNTTVVGLVSDGGSLTNKPAYGFLTRAGSSGRFMGCDTKGSFTVAPWSDGSSANATVASPIPGRATTPVVNAKSYGAKGDGVADDSAAIAAAFTAAGVGGRIVIPKGTYLISSMLTLPDKATLTMYGAVLKQNVANITVLKAGSGCRVLGGQITGLSTDFVARTGSFTPTSIGLKVDAASVSTERTLVDGLRVYGMGQTGIYVNNTPYLTLNNVDIVGPHGLAGVTIPAGDAGCMGVYVNLASPDMTVTGLRVQGTSIGFINSGDSARLSMDNCRFSNIPGQHGAYLQNGNGLTVSNIAGSDVNLNLCKLQIHASNGAHQYGSSFTNINGTNIGDTVLVLSNTDTDLTNSWKFYGVTVSGVSGYNCNRIGYFSSVVGATVEGIAGVLSLRETLTIIDAQDSVFAGIASRGSGYAGIRIGTQTGAATARVIVQDARIYNPGNSNVGGSKQGVSISDGKNITLENVHVIADNGFMDFGIQFIAGETATYRQRNCSGKGFSSRAFGLPAGTIDVKEWSNNDGDGKATLNFPTTRPVRTGSAGDASRYTCSVVPTSGLFVSGDIIDNSAPTAAGTPGWMCTQAGGGYNGSWTASTAYTVGQQVRTAAGRVLAVTTAGTSGSTEPVVGAINGSITDGTVVWTYLSSTLAVFKAMASLAA
jgi:polygalacturonase